jgi:hypothetical protein
MCLLYADKETGVKFYFLDMPIMQNERNVVIEVPSQL